MRGKQLRIENNQHPKTTMANCPYYDEESKTCKSCGEAPKHTGQSKGGKSRWADVSPEERSRRLSEVSKGRRLKKDKLAAEAKAARKARKGIQAASQPTEQ
jgi:hypothetical protein